ncbi:MAG: hypothetical protein Q9227_007680 [Pyrenula ochraceoflavens]
MSYSNLQNYNQYYQSQATNHSHEPYSRQPTSTTLPQPSTSQQYGQGNYNWPSQTQQPYGNLRAENQNYGNQSWKNGQTQRPSYNYQNHRNDYGSSASNGNTATYYGTTSQAPPQNSTAALNSLAYASGLESAGMQDQNQVDRSSQSNTPVSGTFQRTPAIGHERVSSPAQNMYHAYSRSNASNSYSDNRPKSSQQHLAASAAAALAGATKRHQSQQSVNGYQQPASYAPSMGNLVSPSTSTSSLANQNRPASPYASRSANAQKGQRQAPAAQISSAQYHTHSPQQNSNYSHGEPAHYSTSNYQSRSQGTASPYQAPAEIAQSAPGVHQNGFNAVNDVPMDSSIAKDGDSSNSYSQAETPAAGVPDFIDPSKVYNPYHQELERRRREAAQRVQLERQKAQADAEAQQAPTGEPLQGPEQISSAPGTATPKASAQPNNKFSRKPREKKSRQSEPIPKPGAMDSIARQSLTPQVSKQKKKKKQQQTSADENDEIEEMRMMMEKMKRLKNKDPSMFRKMMEDMDGAEDVSTAASHQGAPIQTHNAGRNSVSKPAVAVELMPDQASQMDQLPTPAQAKKKSKNRSSNGTGVKIDRPGGKIAVENNEQNLPDLGRFPAERRGPYRKKESQNVEGATAVKEQSAATSESLQFPAATPKPSHTHQTPVANSSAKLQTKDGKAPPSSMAPTKANNTGTVWPEAKRKSLAEAAIRVLNSHPANQNKQISANDILALLDLNPSYLQLCEHLESKGLALHRGHFARSLLSNVPDLASANQPHSQPHRIQTHELPAASPTPGSVGTPAPTKPVKQDSLVKQEPKGASKQRSKPKLGQPTAPIPKPAPGSKEAQARKRDFSELVDLTLLSDDEDYVMPSKKPKTQTPEPMEEIQMEAPIMGPPSISTDLISNDPSAPLQFNTAAQSTYPQSATPSQQFSPPDKSYAMQHQQMGVTQPQLPVMAKTLDRKEAFKKPFYDSKTIARDILIAAGRHPTEKGLNNHLFSLANRLGLAWECDFTTIDWDSVDPGGPPVPRVAVEDIPAGPPKWALGQRIHFGRRDAASNGDGLTRPTKKHRPHNPAEASTHSQDVSEKPATSSDQGQASSSLLDKSRDTAHDSVPSLDRLKNHVGHASALLNGSSPAPNSSPHTVSSSKMDRPGAVYPSGKRRGRPPGARNKNPTKRHILEQSKAAAPPKPRIEVQPRDQSPPAPHVFQCEMKRCGAELHNLATLRKHIARKHGNASDDDAEKGGYKCWWRKCSSLKQNQEGRLVPSVSFTSESEWQQHIENEHLAPIALKYGDGPSTVYSDPQTVESNAAHYLNSPTTSSTGHGREVVTYSSTPTTIQSYSPDTLVLPVEREPHKSFEKTHGNKELDDKKSAMGIFRALEARKAKIPGIERGGCVLVTAERRATLQEDEDYEGVCMDSDGN